MKVNFQNKKGGFTLIEVLVVIAITSILASFTVVYHSQSRAQNALTVEQAKIVQVLSRAKSLALSGYSNWSSPVCGYGVHMNETAQPQTYTLFSYRVSDCEGITQINTESSAYISMETYTLPNGVRFNETCERQLNSAFFLPPDPQLLIWVNDVFSSGLEAQPGDVCLTAPGTDSELKVTVSVGGQISF